jgi:predicted RNA methylase
LKREIGKEQYFTPNDLAKECVQAVSVLYPLDTFSIVIEPSAGEGAFLSLLPEKTRIGIDIDPKLGEIIEQDFLTWRPKGIGSQEKVLTIGNPPFGARSAIALKFIKHAAEFSDVIAFVLPMSFNKYTFQNMFPREFHLVDSMDCTDSYKTPTGLSYVKTVFQIWERRTTNRKPILRKMNHSHFTMKHAHLSRISDQVRTQLVTDYEFAIAQVGSNFAPKDPHEVTQGSYWFVSPQVEGVRDRFKRLDFSGLARMNLAHMSLSKSDIIQAYDEILIADGVEESGLSDSPNDTLF